MIKLLQQNEEIKRECCKDANLEVCLIVKVNTDFLYDDKIDILGSILELTEQNNYSEFVFNNTNEESALLRYRISQKIVPCCHNLFWDTW